MCLFNRRKKKKPKPVPKPTPGPPVPVPVPSPPPTPGPTPPPPTPSPKQTIHMQVVNRSTVVTDAQVQSASLALQTQITRDYLPIWDPSSKIQVIVEAVGKKGVTASDTWQVLILDNSDQAGALGYHDLTPQGLPVGKVFAATDIQYNESWTVTLSHEALEMLGDPNIDLEVLRKSTGWKYVYENCDAVENNSYTINGIKVSDFVTPQWFKDTGTGQYDFLKVLSRPFTLAPGGYVSVDKGDGQGWTQIFGQLGAAFHGYAARPKVGSRRERRSVPREHWLRSAS